MAARSKHPRGKPCECHGVPKFWRKDKRLAGGGGWGCIVKKRESDRKSQKTWRKANPEKIRANDKAWKKANPEKAYAWQRAWVKNNPEKRREVYRRYEANHIRIYAGGLRLGYYKVDPSEKQKLQAALADFRTQQGVEYKEASSGW